MFPAAKSTLDRGHYYARYSAAAALRGSKRRHGWHERSSQLFPEEQNDYFPSHHFVIITKFTPKKIQIQEFTLETLKAKREALAFVDGCFVDKTFALP